MDCIVHGVAKSWTRLSDFHFTSLHFRWFSGKESICNAGAAEYASLISVSVRSPGEGNGNTLQHSCPHNPKDRVAWLPTVHGVAKSQK